MLEKQNLASNLDINQFQNIVKTILRIHTCPGKTQKPQANKIVEMQFT